MLLTARYCTTLFIVMQLFFSWISSTWWWWWRWWWVQDGRRERRWWEDTAEGAERNCEEPRLYARTYGTKVLRTVHSTVYCKIRKEFMLIIAPVIVAIP